MLDTEYPLGQVVVHPSEVEYGKVNLCSHLDTRGQYP